MCSVIVCCQKGTKCDLNIFEQEDLNADNVKTLKYFLLFSCAHQGFDSLTNLGGVFNTLEEQYKH